MNATKLLKSVETPSFVYCHHTLQDSRNKVQSVLDEISVGNWIAYSYKTNPLLAPYLAELGCAMQVTSISHLAEVKAFLDPVAISNSFYCSGSMTDQDAQVVVESGFYVVVDSVSQLECIERAARTSGRSPRVLIRVDAGQSAVDSPFGTSGMLQGIDIQKLGMLLATPYENIRIIGVHNHFGSQVTSLNAWKKNIESIAGVIRDLDFPLEILNLGGGTPVNYDTLEVPTIEDIYRKCLTSSIRSIQDIHPNLKVVVEPGRFIAGPCGFLVTTATNLHRSETRQGANLDASLFASFQDRFLSNLSFQFPVIEPLAMEDAPTETILRGSSPASIDYFGVYKQLPDVNLGDKVIFGMAGAYASSMGSSFSGVARPAEYLMRDGAFEGIRDAQ